MKSFIITVALVIAALSLAGPRVASAQASTSAPSPSVETRARARDAYARGQRLFEAGQYAEAQVAFEEAYALVPNPVVLLGVASAQERRGQPAAARATLERYLAEAPNARDRAEIEARVAALSASASEEAALEREATEAVADDAGDEAVDASEDAVADEAGSTDDEAVSDASEEAAPEAPATPPGPSDAVWALAAVGAVGLVTGTVFGFLALSRQSDFDAAPSASIADEGEAFALAADIAFGVALAGGVAAIALYATDRPSASSAESASLRLLPLATRHGGGLLVDGRF